MAEIWEGKGKKNLEKRKIKEVITWQKRKGRKTQGGRGDKK